MFNVHTSHRDLKNRKQIISVSKLRMMMHSFDAFDVCNNDSNNIGMVKSGKYLANIQVIAAQCINNEIIAGKQST